MMNLFENWDELDEKKLALLNRKMVYGKDIMLVRNEIHPNTATPAHAHPHEQMLVVLSGACDITTDGETRHLEKNGIAWFPSNVLHSVTNTEEEPLIALDIFTPIREDFLK